MGIAGLWALEDMPMGAAAPGVGGRGADGAAEDGAIGAAGAAATGAAEGAVEGIRIDGPPAGLGGNEMRTVCFFCAASAGFGGSGVAPGAPGGGVFSDITLLQGSLESFRRTSMRLRRGICHPSGMGVVVGANLPLFAPGGCGSLAPTHTLSTQ